MKVKVRDSINTTKQINLRDLTPVQKVTVAIQCAIDESKMMQNKVQLANTNKAFCYEN